MALGKFNKTPTEIKRYAVDYVDWLDAGEYLATTTVTATPSTPTNPLLIDVQGVGVNDTDLSFFVAGGVSGTTYTLVTRATTSNGQAKEDTIILGVRSL